jgi:hypothetical protein
MYTNEEITNLFHAVGLESPTIDQIRVTRQLIDGNVSNPQQILESGLKTADHTRRWRKYPSMSTIDSLPSHHDRVARLLIRGSQYISVAFEDFDFKKAIFMSQNHDMTEGISPL